MHVSVRVVFILPFTIYTPERVPLPMPLRMRVGRQPCSWILDDRCEARNSLWPGDAIWRQESGSSFLDQENGVSLIRCQAIN